MFFAVSLICFMWMNTGTRPREPAEPSTYSDFNRILWANWRDFYSRTV